MQADLAREELSDAALWKSGVNPTILEWGASRRRTSERSVEVSERRVTLRVEWEGEEPPWVEPTLNALGELLALPANWDSYGAYRVDPESVASAGRALCLVMGSDTIPPTIVPTSEGGIQLEWHARGVDLEIDISPTGRRYISCVDRQRETEWEGDFNIHLDRLLSIMSRLSHHH
jgi:hypothetical protein